MNANQYRCQLDGLYRQFSNLAEVTEPGLYTVLSRGYYLSEIEVVAISPRRVKTDSYTYSKEGARSVKIVPADRIAEVSELLSLYRQATEIETKLIRRIKELPESDFWRIRAMSEDQQKQLIELLES